MEKKRKSVEYSWVPMGDFYGIFYFNFLDSEIFDLES